MDIRAAEISAMLKEQIKNFGQEAEVSEIGQVFRSVMVSLASMVSIRSKPAKWSNSRAASGAWR